jgi:hypothetical protein
MIRYLYSLLWVTKWITLRDELACSIKSFRSFRFRSFRAREKDVHSGDTVPCRMTGVTLP